jgi:hypothetical protein
VARKRGDASERDGAEGWKRVDAEAPPYGEDSRSSEKEPNPQPLRS